MKKKKKFQKVLVILPAVFLLLCGILAILLIKHAPDKLQTVRVGYFHGGRTTILYRAFVDGYFDKEGLNVQLLTKNLHTTNFFVIPKDPQAINDNSQFGKATGVELIDGMIKNQFDAGAVGGDSFIAAVTKKAPIVAVAELGHDESNNPGHAILFRKSISINSPSDIKGKTLGVRRAGPGDYARLVEFLKSAGVDPQKDVTILKDLPDDEMDADMVNGKIDGGFFHVMGAIPLVENNVAYIYKTLDWVNPEVVNAVLVFRKDFVKNHPDLVEKFITAYMKRIKYEHSLPESVRIDSGNSKGKGMKMQINPKLDSQNVGLPQYDFPPLLSPDVAREAQSLLYEDHDISTKVDLKPYIDNTFVSKIYEKIK
jgi:ABC-type nitrate/sulfonate/bicarbonate transport system substrate-binding protein